MATHFVKNLRKFEEEQHKMAIMLDAYAANRSPFHPVNEAVSAVNRALFALRDALNYAEARDPQD